MTTLYVMRHAHADQTGAFADKQRPLDDSGRIEARTIGGRLVGAGIDYVLVSPAIRTQQTVRGLGLDLAEDRIEPESRLYYGTTSDYIDCLRELPDDVGCALLCGHNPSVAYLCRRLTDPEESDLRAMMLIETHFPTATCCHFEFDGTWADLAGGTARLVETLRVKLPKG